MGSCYRKTSINRNVNDVKLLAHTLNVIDSFCRAVSIIKACAGLENRIPRLPEALLAEKIIFFSTSRFAHSIDEITRSTYRKAA